MWAITVLTTQRTQHGASQRLLLFIFVDLDQESDRGAGSLKNTLSESSAPIKYFLKVLDTGPARWGGARRACEEPAGVLIHSLCSNALRPLAWYSSWCSSKFFGLLQIIIIPVHHMEKEEEEKGALEQGGWTGD